MKSFVDLGSNCFHVQWCEQSLLGFADPNGNVLTQLLELPHSDSISVIEEYEGFAEHIVHRGILSAVPPTSGVSPIWRARSSHSRARMEGFAPYEPRAHARGHTNSPIPPGGKANFRNTLPHRQCADRPILTSTGNVDSTARVAIR